VRLSEKYAHGGEAPIVYNPNFGKLMGSNTLQRVSTGVTMKGISACVFDAYGTLFDFSSAVRNYPLDGSEHQKSELIKLWRDKQIQYTWLRTIQNRYSDFWSVTSDALEYALASLRFDPKHHKGLMELYLKLEPFPEVTAVLQTLKQNGYQLVVLSNGTQDMLRRIIEHAQLNKMFDHVLSADDIGVFKTSPKVYQYALDVLKLPAEACSFQSSNAWDAFAASDFGMKVVWCNRYGQTPERLPGKPDYEIQTLEALPHLLSQL
jgi:2-haloacid dehalogenase